LVSIFPDPDPPIAPRAADALLGPYEWKFAWFHFRNPDLVSAQAYNCEKRGNST
jgi:hypothetical protein